MRSARLPIRRKGASHGRCRTEPRRPCQIAREIPRPSNACLLKTKMVLSSSGRSRFYGAWRVDDPRCRVIFRYPPVRLLVQLLAVLGLHLGAAAIVAIVGWITCVFFGLGLVLCFV